MKMFLWGIVIVLTASQECLSDDTLIQTPSGPIRGIIKNDQVTGDKVYQFRGVRYAKSPTGNLRFRKPEPADKWDNEYDATSFGPACAQNFVPMLKDGSDVNAEDCLFLNIYVPRDISRSRKLSVMVWFHGGGFSIGNGHFYDGTRLAVDGDVIVVTINYRLGVFGFLSFYHPAAKGNYGLWDQSLALKWVHDNIASFGGNPDSVTIFGESAGGMSVSYQSIQPLNKGYFQRAIAQSGAVSRFLLMTLESSKTVRKRLSERTSCSQTDLYGMVDCLRELPKDVLLNATDLWQDQPTDSVSLEISYAPCVDGEFIPQNPIAMLKTENSPQSEFYKSLDFMTGTTSQEGSMVLMMAMPQVQEQFKFNMSISIPFDFICMGILKPFVQLQFDGNLEVLNRLCKFYKTDLSVDAQSNRAADCVADILMTPAVAEMLEIHSSLTGGKTYQYQFSQMSPTTMIPPPEWFKGAGHGDELLYLFYTANVEEEDMLNVELSDTDKTIAKWMIALWTSFAKTGIPSAGKGTLPWLQYDNQKRIYLDVHNELSLRQNLHLEAVKVWEGLPSPDLNKLFKHDEL